MNNILSKQQILHVLFWVFLPFTAAYFLTAFFNQINAMLAPYLFHDVNINAGQLGLTTSVYLLVFALAQLPLGTFLDHYGPRKVQSTLFVVASIGILIFATANSSWLLLIGRGLIGVGMSSGLMSGFRALRSWLPKEKIPLANGSLMAAGTLGAICSTVPVEMTLQIMSWRMLLIILILITLSVSAWIYFLVPDHASDSNKSNLTIKQQIFETKHIFKSAYFWKIAPLVAFAFGSNMSIVGLWAGPWLSDVALLNEKEIANHLLVISIALVMGIALWGIIADRLTIKFNWPIARIIGVGAFFYILVQILLISGTFPGSYFIWFAFGFMSRCTTLAYAAVSQHFHQSYAGRATTALNLLFFLTAFLTQFGMGMVIDIWPNDLSGHYSSHGYYVAFTVVIVLQMLGFMWFWYHHIRDSLKRNQVALGNVAIKLPA
jgi:predicted MFS family arabinose efflux permease